MAGLKTRQKAEKEREQVRNRMRVKRKENGVMEEVRKESKEARKRKKTEIQLLQETHIGSTLWLLYLGFLKIKVSIFKISMVATLRN